MKKCALKAPQAKFQQVKTELAVYHKILSFLLFVKAKKEKPSGVILLYNKVFIDIILEFVDKKQY